MRHELENNPPDIGSFALDLFEITSDLDTSFDRKARDIPCLWCDRFYLEIGILAENLDNQYTSRHVCPPSYSLHPGQSFHPPDAYC